MPVTADTQIKTRKINEKKLLNANVINILYEITIKTLHLIYNCFPQSLLLMILHLSKLVELASAFVYCSFLLNIYCTCIQ